MGMEMALSPFRAFPYSTLRLKSVFFFSITCQWLSPLSATITWILFSFTLVIASANDHGYCSKPELFHKPKLDVKEKPLPIAVQGLILCKSGPKTIPIKGAVARITCQAVDGHGYETAPFSILSKATDSKGYYIATLYPQELNYDKLKLTECKAFLEKSPLETCKVATDVNKGISGAPLAYYRLLDNKKMKLYSLPPIIYTSQPKPISNGY